MLAANLLLIAAPLLWWQGRRARTQIPALPEAPGRRGGDFSGGADEGLQWLFVGDSPFAGVGVGRYASALPAVLARALRNGDFEIAGWRVRARSGLRMSAMPALLASAADNAAAVPPIRRVVVVCAGINDVTAGTGTRAFRAALRRTLAAAGPSPVVLCGIAPIGEFATLPRLLRAWLGLRARAFDALLAREASRRDGVLHVPVRIRMRSGDLAEDGFHPSASGVRRWVAALIEALGGAAGSKWWAVLDSNQRPAD